eukprot:5634721-Prymnesium_polylepis.2
MLPRGGAAACEGTHGAAVCGAYGGGACGGGSSGDRPMPRTESCSHDCILLSGFASGPAGRPRPGTRPGTRPGSRPGSDDVRKAIEHGAPPSSAASPSRAAGLPPLQLGLPPLPPPLPPPDVTPAENGWADRWLPGEPAGEDDGARAAGGAKANTPKRLGVHGTSLSPRERLEVGRLGVQPDSLSSTIADAPPRWTLPLEPPPPSQPPPQPPPPRKEQESAPGDG